MYKCLNCRNVTETLKSIPKGCDDKCFTPREVKTIHHLTIANNQRIVTCSGKPLKEGGVGIGTIYGVNCLRCRAKLDVQEEIEKPDEISQSAPMDELDLPPESDDIDLDELDAKYADPHA